MTMTDKLADVRRLLDKIMSREAIRALVTDATGALRALPEMDPQAVDRVDEMIMSDPALVEVFVAAYERLFTHEEILAMLEFYGAGAGLKTVTLITQLSRDTMKVWQKWHAEEFTPRVEALVAAMRPKAKP